MREKKIEKIKIDNILFCKRDRIVYVYVEGKKFYFRFCF